MFSAWHICYDLYHLNAFMEFVMDGVQNSTVNMWPGVTQFWRGFLWDPLLTIYMRGGFEDT